ncbi:hypothetical protein PsorP6_015520 [Peronosclerospora sorghi]|uniref:Uncharacterized protein n=1 Tax=Peronosclerospora sorghi TaxID=230839 RepID=A0ACC0WQY1_9STRA|nr:hypothetical protein PsorP6_015520 [Peronosclerospora sorghi]
MAPHETTSAALGLGARGITKTCKLVDQEKKDNERSFVANGTFAVDTGKCTGRSRKDKFLGKQPPSEDHVGWGPRNPPTTAEVVDALIGQGDQALQLCGSNVRVGRLLSCENETSRLKVRISTELAWQHHFVTNRFMRPEDLSVAEKFHPDSTVIHACNIVDEEWKAHGLHSEVFVLFNIEKHKAIIGGPFYGGDMNEEGHLQHDELLLASERRNDHACVRQDRQGRGHTAIFFGLFGNGKTTLSAEPKRELIGDDEHGWDDGVFNFEGGWYAKTIDLSKEKNEPDVFNAIRPNSRLENGWIDANNEPDYFTSSKTDNGRVLYVPYLAPSAPRTELSRQSSERCHVSHVRRVRHCCRLCRNYLRVRRSTTFDQGT